MHTLPLGPATLTLYGPHLRSLPADEAAAFGEEPLQLLENGSAEFVLTGAPPGWRLREGGAVTLSRASAHAGTIIAGNEAGLLTLTLDDAHGTPRATAGLEIVTEKLGYREDFRTLLEDLTRHATDLLLRLRTDITSPFEPTPNDDPQTLVQQCFFLRGLLESRSFSLALARILSDPHHALEPFPTEAALGRSTHLGGTALRQLVATQPRRPVPSTHALHQRGLTTVPLALTQPRSQPSLDTPENRFVHYALTHFTTVLRQLDTRLTPDRSLAADRLRRELRHLRRPLESALAHPLFTTLSPLTRLPLESAVLQRRSGYREVLHAYLAAQQALRLRWDGGEAVFGGGRRDVAALYEFWCFFQLVEAVQAVFGVCFPPEALLTPTANGVALQLRRGTTLVWEAEGVRLAYNPTLATWTRPVRPDITLTVGDASYHFDAKYRLKAEGDALTDDILTMHAYRDAISGTVASVVLYPGEVAHWWPHGTGGLGTLPLAPRHGRAALETFLRAIQ